MSNIVALEWDAREARVCIGRTRGSGIVVDQAFAIALSDADEGDSGSATDQIAKVLKQRGAAKSDALVAIGRSSIELRQMQMPPCPDEELADMVRFQAMRQFSGITDDWPLDYVPLHRLNDDEAVHVLAAAINPNVINPVKSLCKDVDVSLKKILLRPFSAASLMKPATSENQCRALVDMLADEADLTVLVGDDVVFVRTVRLPATNDMAARANALMGEIRRTIPAARNQAGGREVESVTLCGDHAELGPLEEIITSKLGKTVEYLDPFSTVATADEVAARHPENPGRYASLLGAMNAYVGRASAGIDFANPRRRPKPKSQKGRYALVASLAAIAVALVCVIGWFELKRLGDKLSKLDVAVEANEKQTEKMKERTEHLIAVNTLLDEKDIDWLRELREFADCLPDPDLAMISNLTLSPNPKGEGGKITVRGFIDDSSTIDELRRRWDAPWRRVDAGPVVTDRQYAQYPYRITEALYVLPSARKEALGDQVKEGTNFDSVLPPDDDQTRSGDESPVDADQEGQPEDPKAADPEKSADLQEAKPEEGKADEAKQEEAKPEEAKPAEAKPDETSEEPKKAPPPPSDDLTERPSSDAGVRTVSRERSSR